MFRVNITKYVAINHEPGKDREKYYAFWACRSPANLLNC